MASEKRQSDHAHRKLATLEQVVEALLCNKTPYSPIVKEKIQQAEDIILVEIPFENEAMLESWSKKLSQWWTQFATQQVESKVEAKKYILPGFQGFQPLNDAAVSTSSRETFYVPPKTSLPAVKVSQISKKEHQSQSLPKASSASTEGLANVPEPKANSSYQKVSENKQQSSVPEVSGTTSTLSKECIPANVVVDKPKVAPVNTSTHPAAVVPEHKSTFKPFPDGYSWGSEAPASAFVAPKERQPSGSSKTGRFDARMEAAKAETNVCPSNAPAPIVHNERSSSFAQNPKETAPPTDRYYGGYQAPAPVVTNPEPIFEKVPDDFDWGAPPQ